MPGELRANGCATNARVPRTKSFRVPQRGVTDASPERLPVCAVDCVRPLFGNDSGEWTIGALEAQTLMDGFDLDSPCLRENKSLAEKRIQRRGKS